jgi:4-hydroxy-tetrahydrodipicolinate reductase
MRIAINGACGRMGRSVGRIALEERIEVAAAIDVSDVGGSSGFGPLVARRLESKVDVLIDFSTPEAAIERIEDCLRLEVPIVVCTTGFTHEQEAKVREASKRIPVLWSSNMSFGMNVLFKHVPEIAAKLGREFDVDVVETHHRFKKDAPSGTAKTLAARIEAATGRHPNVHAVRSGDVVGEHRVIFGTLGETIEIVHRASSRDLFARGALRAAAWLAQAKPGLYSMLEVVG